LRVSGHAFLVISLLPLSFFFLSLVRRLAEYYSNERYLLQTQHFTPNFPNYNALNYQNAIQYILVTPPASSSPQESSENEPVKSDGKGKKNTNPPKPKTSSPEKVNDSKVVNHDVINISNSFRNLNLNGNYFQIDDIHWFDESFASSPSSAVTSSSSNSSLPLNGILSFDFVSYNVSSKIMPPSVETHPISVESGLETIPSFGKSDLLKLANERKSTKKKKLLSFSCSLGQQEEVLIYNLLLFLFHSENANSFKLVNRYYRNPKFLQNQRKQKEIKDFYEQSSSESEGDYEDDDDDDEDNLMKGIEETAEEGTGTVTETNSETNSRVSSANISKANNSFSFGGGATAGGGGNIRGSQEIKEENPFSVMKSIKRSIAERRMSSDMSEVSSVNPMETEKEKRKKKRKFKKNKMEKEFETMVKHQFEDIVATVYDRYLASYQSLLVRKVNHLLSESTLNNNVAPRSVTLSMVHHLLRSAEQT
jgi:hypothetical protein